MKNTERLSKEILDILRYMQTGHENDKSKDNDINLMTPNEIFKMWLEYNGFKSYEEKIKDTFYHVYGITSDIKDLFLSRADDYRKWCCWVLDEEEILHAMKGVVPESYGLEVSDDNKRTFVDDVAEKFKDALSTIADDWEYELGGCVNDVIETWQDRK